MADATPETWRSVVGWEGWYEVSDQGRVRRVAARPRGGHAEPLLAGSLTKKGYRAVNLRRGGRSRKYFVHQLILTAFIGPKPEGQECNHKDGDKANNRLGNLEWVTPKGNTEHAAMAGLRPVLLRDMTGQRFGRLVVKARAGSTKQRQALWVCYCDCDAITTVSGNDLRRGHTTSCGCLRADWTRDNQPLLVGARQRVYDRHDPPATHTQAGAS
jgi:hypothetical protein